MWKNIGIGIITSCLATIVVLLTRIIFYRLRDSLPAGSLFHGIRNALEPCLVLVRRMTDSNESGKYKTPIPNYSPVSDGSSIDSLKYGKNQNIPWVTSTSTAQALAHVLNVLGRIGRIDNIEVSFVDEKYDRWDVPQILIGGSFKTQRAFETCRPYFRYIDKTFKLCNNKPFSTSSREEDIGLLQKMINPTNGKPVWIVMGFRGAGTIAASYALLRWWKYLGWIYGKKTFGVLVVCNDKDGWQQSHIISLYPKPNQFTKLKHPYAWYVLKKAMCY